MSELFSDSDLESVIGFKYLLHFERNQIIRFSEMYISECNSNSILSVKNNAFKNFFQVSMFYYIGSRSREVFAKKLGLSYIDFDNFRFVAPSQAQQKRVHDLIMSYIKP